MTDKIAYPAEFKEWVGRKISVEALAMLAATLDAPQTEFNPRLLIERAINLVFESWSFLKEKAAKEDPLAKAPPKD